MTDDPWEDPSAKAWARHVIRDMVPKLADSTFSISLVPTDGMGDIKFWVELGASIMMNKPIMAVLFGDGPIPIPPKLALVADEVVRLPNGVNPEGSVLFKEALERMMGKLDD